MKKLLILPALGIILTVPAVYSRTNSNPFVGRWDLTVTAATVTYPNWMEVIEKDGGLQVRAQLRTGNVRFIDAKMDGPHLIVTAPAPTDAPGSASDGYWELTVKGDKLTGIQKHGDAEDAKITGFRAPALKHPAPRAWTDPETLFNGKDLTGWEPINNTPPSSTPKPAASHWVAKNGELVNEGRGSNLRTVRTFDDFKLHIEFNIPPGENSGIYLRGRYETQVAGGAPPQGVQAASHPAGPSTNLAPGLGSIYGFLKFPVSDPKPAGEWQTYDIALVGRYVTVTLNGFTGIDNQEIPGITGGAIDSNEGKPGPIYMQGDHHGGIRYRNITISVPKH
ncbi:MAG TPA: DUF1080 domain-containing protein [Edaphobacter sp.]|nr:DUF1080 domain-containing protein [Edaphobacter sp.]